MAKTTRVRDQDKFMLRLPDGMRDRIKSKADRAGMSMNEAIVWCLESFFPAPVTIEEKIADLAQMVAILKEAGPGYKQIDDIYNALREALDGVSEGQVQAPDGFGGMVSDRLLRFDEEKHDQWREKHESPFEDSLYRGLDMPKDLGGDLDDDR